MTKDEAIVDTFPCHEVINDLAHTMALTDIALLDEGEALVKVMRRVLSEFAAGAFRARYSLPAQIDVGNWYGFWEQRSWAESWIET